MRSSGAEGWFRYQLSLRVRVGRPRRMTNKWEQDVSCALPVRLRAIKQRQLLKHRLNGFVRRPETRRLLDQG